MFAENKTELQMQYNDIGTKSFVNVGTDYKTSRVKRTINDRPKRKFHAGVGYYKPLSQHLREHFFFFWFEESKQMFYHSKQNLDEMVSHDAVNLLIQSEVQCILLFMTLGTKA